jgi:TolB protein
MKQQNGVHMAKTKWLLMIIVLVLIAGRGEAKIYLDVYGKTYKKITIGVPPLKNEKPGALSADMTEVLNKDLDLSGFFVVAPPTLIDKELSDEGVEKQEVRFGNWRSIGIELLCKGKLQDRDGELILEAYLYDTTDGTLMLGKRYRAPSGDWRRVAHRFADDVILAVTGEKGIMSSKVVFVGGTRNHKDIYVADLDGYNFIQGG